MAVRSTDVFISYRRSDAAGHARLLFRELGQYFETGRIFFDRGSIESGDVFPDRLREAIADAKVVLVLIGADWVSATDASGRRRLEDPNDIVRLELGLALQHGKHVIPVLFDGTPVPPAAALPEGLKPLATRDVQLLGGKEHEYHRQLAELVRLLAKVPGMPQPRKLPDTISERPYRGADQRLSPHFEGRDEELVLLDEGFEQLRGADQPVVRALWGMGGSGKSQLALKYTEDHRDRYAGVWWFRSETSALLDADFAELATVGRVPKADEREPARNAVRRWLARQPTWLLVFDNAEDPEQLRLYLPDRGGHDVVITSRNPVWGAIAQPIEVKPWAKEQGVAFLQRRLSVSLENDFEQLWEALGGLPLALEQAAAFIEETGAGAAEYCAALARGDAGGAILEKGSAATGYPRTVAGAVALAFERLSAPAGQLLRLLGWMAPEPVPESVIREHSELLPDDLRNAITRPLGFDETVGELRRFGLADRLPAAAALSAPRAGGRFGSVLRVHRLTQTVVRARLSDISTDPQVVLATLVAAFPGDPEVPDAWPTCAALLPHARYPIMWAAAGRVEPAQLAFLLERCGRYQLASGSGEGAYESFGVSLALRRRGLGDEHPATLRGMNNLAASLWKQGDLVGARGLQEQVLAVSRRVLGAEHPDTLTSMNNLAETLRAQGDLAGALELQRQVLVASRQLLGDEHRDTLRGMGNLAGTLAAQGDLVGARGMEERVLVGRRRMQGAEHPDTLTSMSSLAATMWAQGDFAGARGLEEEALASRRRVLGDEHPDTLTSMSNLGSILSAQGDFAGARGLKEEALAIRRRVQGDEHPATLTGMNNLASTLLEQGDLAGARELHERVLAARRRVLGDEHPATLTSMSNLASVLSAQGDFAGARGLDEEVLAVRRRVLGDEHPATLTAMSNLASTLREQGDLVRALKVEEQVLAGMRQALGAEHPDTLTSMNNLAETLRAQGDFAGARGLQEEVLAGMSRVLGAEHPGTLTSMNNLAETLRAQRDLAGARGLQEQVLAGMSRVLGAEHPDTLTSMTNLAETLREQGDLVGARVLQEQALAGRRRVLGDEHPATLRSMSNLAETVHEQSDLADARVLQEQVRAIRRRVLGDDTRPRPRT